MKWSIFLCLLAISFGSAAQIYWHDEDYHPITEGASGIRKRCVGWAFYRCGMQPIMQGWDFLHVYGGS